VIVTAITKAVLKTRSVILSTFRKAGVGSP
jgi:hypothetical protein